MLEEKYNIIPCSGLDKKLGCLAREVAIEFSKENTIHNLICPVLLNSGDEKYEKSLQEFENITVNGCMTRCATKLADERKIKVKSQIYIPDMIKKFGIKLSKGLSISEQDTDLVKKIVSHLVTELATENRSESSQELQNGPLITTGFNTYTKDKFIFDVPKEKYFFNENDCWAIIEGDIAVLGVSDYVQNKVGDIMFVDLPEIGTIIEQFDDAGSLESVKTVVDVISPVSGKVIATNLQLDLAPELINREPYQKGWIVKLQIENFEEERDLLLDCQAYFDYMKKKVDEESKKL
ncbi:MAG: glycine cleavage system protein GcvH [Promethearchaeota archaeon]